MEANVSAKLLFNLVEEKYGIYKSHMAHLLSVWGDNDQKSKVEANQRLFDASNELANVLANSDRPSWLTESIAFTLEYKEKNQTSESVASGSSWRLLQRAMKIYGQAIAHKWDFDAQVGNEAKYDFDEIYQIYRESSDLTKLFDALIKILNEMIGSGEIDSLRAIKSLNELLGTIRQNKDGSYFSTMASWEFIKNFTKNYAWEQISSIPGVKSLKISFEKTMSDMDMEMEKLHKNISDEFKKRCNFVGQTALTYKKSDNLLPDSRSDG